MIEPIRLTLEVECVPEHAFRTWAERTSTWWPADHTTAWEPGLEICFEPRAGGRIFERTTDGREFEWGRVLAWEPPHRLVYSWHLRADAADATEVEIRFVPIDPPDGDDRGRQRPRTRLEIEHRGWERLGDRGLPRRDANFGGWSTLLPHFEAAITRD